MNNNSNDNNINNSAPPPSHRTVIAIATISQAGMVCLFFTIVTNTFYFVCKKRNMNPHSLNLCSYEINFLSVFRVLKTKMLHYFIGRFCLEHIVIVMTKSPISATYFNFCLHLSQLNYQKSTGVF